MKYDNKHKCFVTNKIINKMQQMKEYMEICGYTWKYMNVHVHRYILYDISYIVYKYKYPDSMMTFPDLEDRMLFPIDANVEDSYK